MPGTEGVGRLLDENYEQVASYRSTPRREVVDLITRAPANAIELGCGSGATGALIKKRFPGARMTGIEPHRASAKQAAERLDRVLAGKLEDFDLAREGFEPGSVDLLVAADVLEHMYDPWKALRSLRPFLAPDATVVASLPNVRNLALLVGLADKGRWRYQSEGLLDATHIRFFTRKEMLEMFAECGYRVERCVFKIDPRLDKLFQAHKGKPSVDVSLARLSLGKLSPQEFKELCSLQILLLARPAPAAAAARVS